ncbi:RNA polymerase sigma-70 factor [Pedobacter yulinensis]|uniref:RNA polymerase sigma-70 factor n=1 Tax=Pedobacter yulinensis TaxID=2126353 RepID=A0A2T3HJ89_9SPHI|nr:RNA polymerase sigma-70 factor [Pedobacter yulinensis]PST82504.1 RNA polymerase sigma-70 factor [Pedobacter yulinensis]
MDAQLKTKYAAFSDGQLTDCLYTGDSDAFSEIYRRYWKTMLGIAYNRLKSLEQAKDVVHDVMVWLWKHRAAQRIDQIGPYLATAVKYRVLEELRKGSVRASYQDQLQPDHGCCADTEDVLHYRAVLKMVREEVELLPEKCRIIFKYSREEHLSNREIAERLQLSVSTVENQLHKALGRLRLVVRNFHLFFLFFFT